MARSEITGKRKLAAHNVSHSNIKTPRWQLKLTTGDLRTVDKIGLLEFAKKHGAKVA
jgi:large subunit ribosomal protein L28